MQFRSDQYMVKCDGGNLACMQPILPAPAGCPGAKTRSVVKKRSKAKPRGRALMQTVTGCAASGGFNSVFNAYGPKVMTK